MISNLTIHVFLLFGMDPTSHDLIVKAVFPSEKAPKGRGESRLSVRLLYAKTAELALDLLCSQPFILT